MLSSVTPIRQLTDDFENRFRTGDTPWEDPHPWAGLDKLFERFASSGTSILDVGCGLGTNALRLATLGYRVRGIDVSQTAIEKAITRRNAAGLDCEFLCANIFTGDHGNWDIVFDRGCLHGFADTSSRARFALSVATVLQPGGLWIDISGSNENAESPDIIQKLALPRLTLADLAAATESNFETIEIRQGVFGMMPDTDFRAWVGIYRRRKFDILAVSSQYNMTSENLS